MIGAGAEALAIVVDISSSSWSALNAEAKAIEDQSNFQQSSAQQASERRCNSSEFCTAVELFAAAFAINNRSNSITVIARNDSEGGYVFPFNAGDGVHDPMGTRPASVRATLAAGFDKLRGAVDADAIADADGMAQVTHQHTFDKRYASLASCMSLALLYLARVRRTRPTIRARILVLQAGPDVPAQYVPVVNAAYAAQPMGVPIDSIMLSRHASVFLQQSAHLTGGLHLNPIPRAHAHLLEYLFAMALPDAGARRSMQLPPQHAVDMRAHCFCHRRHVTQAWLCTICLSVWCTSQEACPTCSAGAIEAP